jgi:hypothetical protein
VLISFVSGTGWGCAQAWWYVHGVKDNAWPGESSALSRI